MGTSHQWMLQHQYISLQQSISIDWNEEALQVWQLRTRATILKTPLCYDVVVHDFEAGILGNIENDDWMNIFRHQTNLIFTMSPPCQPWSLGGKGQGFYPSMVCAWLTPSRKFDELDRFAFVLNVLTR